STTACSTCAGSVRRWPRAGTAGAPCGWRPRPRAQAVLVSGATVMVAVAGLLLAGDGVLSSIAVGSMLVVLVAVIGSLTVLPALLAKLGHRVERGRIPLLGRRLERRRQRGGGAWA